MWPYFLASFYLPWNIISKQQILSNDVGKLFKNNALLKISTKWNSPNMYHGFTIGCWEQVVQIVRGFVLFACLH